MELFVLYKDGQPVVVTVQGKKQPKVYLSKKNAKNAMANMGGSGYTIVPFVPKKEGE